MHLKNTDIHKTWRYESQDIKYKMVITVGYRLEHTTTYFGSGCCFAQHFSVYDEARSWMQTVTVLVDSCVLNMSVAVSNML